MMADLPSQPARELSNGVSIPQLGLGVFQAARGEQTYRAVREALRQGYRHIDTAAIYRNEEDVGRAIRDSGIARDEIFVTSKLWNADQGYDSALAGYAATRQRLGLDRLDLYLLHWPVPGKRLDSWRALEALYAAGEVRAIGVSNFMARHLDELLARCSVVPHVNQIELSPFLQQAEVCTRCTTAGICIEAYSPLTKGRRLTHPRVVAIAQRVARSAAQVLIRWSLQRGFVVLPKSVHGERIGENLAVFDFALDAATMAELDGLEEGLVTGWDPRHER